MTPRLEDATKQETKQEMEGKNNTAYKQKPRAAQQETHFATMPQFLQLGVSKFSL